MYTVPVINCSMLWIVVWLSTNSCVFISPAPVYAPNISRGHSHSNTKTAKSRTWSGAESQSSSNTSCQVLCSVKNDRQVSLSWFRANQLLSQTSSPDVNTTLSLHLDIDEKDNTVYSCVSANPVSNDTTYLNITAMCSSINQKGLSTSSEFYRPKVKIVILCNFKWC